ncbi:MAG: response regulator transcription factor [Clostridiales Family XIII bacterium]|jgi:two-component system alkaline phosphatase synthesis response regulator PhoP|nr:response regulator transcription factor [Clostridiales Family XIII bacterium]
MGKIFIVEDDDNIREIVAYALSSAGFHTEGFADGDSFFVALAKGRPALVVLDIMLPGDDGMTILKKLKRSEKAKEIPVIMLTAKGSEFDRVSGLDLGADDYITKPFSVLEVIARVKAVLRRCEGDAGVPSELRVGDVALDDARHTVTAGGDDVVLTNKEYQLLQCLMMNEGIVLTRAKLLDRVWGFDYNGESRTIDMHVKSLRQKLGASGEMIKTVRNVGYKIED